LEYLCKTSFAVVALSNIVFPKTPPSNDFSCT
jgi:hypothetical protein